MKNLYYALIFALFVFANLLLLRHLSPTYIITATVNTFITSLSLFAYQNNPFSLYKLLNLFILIFFVLANALQNSTGAIVTSLFIDFTPQDYESFQLLTLAILLVYNAVYYYTYRYTNKALKLKSFRKKTSIQKNERNTRNKLLLYLSIFALIIVLLHFNGSISKLLFRGTTEDISNVGRYARGSKMMGLLFSKIIRPIPFCCYLHAALFNINKKTRVILFFIMLITLFPTGLSRNAAAMYWIPVLLARFTFLRRRNVFIFLMSFGLLVVFPFLGNFRYYNGSIETDFSLRYLITMNFDASQEFMATMKLNIVTNGSQLLGALFFFIPRSIWPTKPIGSGAFLASHQYDTFSNISMPFWGEGYINFGYWGIFIFTVFIAWLTSKLDCGYWSIEKQSSKKNALHIGLYLISIGSFLFILRGDLLSSYAYTVGTCLSFVIVYMFTTKDFIFNRKRVILPYTTKV